MEHFLEFCMGINDERVALMTSINIFLNSNDFNSLSMKDRWLFILTDAGYDEFTEWKPFGGIVAKGIHEMMRIKHEAIGNYTLYTLIHLVCSYLIYIYHIFQYCSHISLHQWE